MKRILPFLAAFVLALSACEKEDEVNIISQGDYLVKEYNLERNPSVNPWGVGMDFIHTGCQLTDTDLDYLYFSPDTTNAYDIKFYTVKAYYTDDNGDTKTEGCPAMLLGEDVTACKIGEGINYFDSLTVISEEMIALLVSEPEVDYESYKIDGKYDRTTLFAAIDQCVIGRCFRSNVLVVPDGKTEQEVQPVFLVKTAEGGYAKFMVKQFQADAPNEKQTVVRWQVITE
jgi:hypothetical protein